jgi:O-antigen ligase
MALIGALSIASLEVQRRQVRVAPVDVSAFLVTATAACTLVLIRLPLLRGDSRSAHYALLAPFVVCIAWMWPRARAATSRGMLLMFGAYVTILLVAILRGGHGKGITDILTLAVVAIFALLLLPSARSDEERRARLIAVALAPGLYALANMVLHLGGVQPPATAGVSNALGLPSQVLGWVGVSALRTQFPLGVGINAFGVVTALGLAGACVVWWQSRGPLRWFAAWCVIGSLYCVAYSDTRSALAAVIGVLALLALFRRIKPIRWLVVIVPLSPFVMMWLIGQLSAAGASVALSRTGDDFATGTNRFYIWRGALQVLDHFDLQQLVGWGEGGQVPSGAAAHYYWLFSRQPNPLQPAHNFMLQTVLDTGYLGLAVTVLLLAATIVRLEAARRVAPRTPVSAILAMTLVGMLSGLTEALPTTTVGQEALIMTLFAMAFATQPAMLAAVAPAPARASRLLRSIPAYAALR